MVRAHREDKRLFRAHKEDKMALARKAGWRWALAHRADTLACTSVDQACTRSSLRGGDTHSPSDGSMWSCKWSPWLKCGTWMFQSKSWACKCLSVDDILHNSSVTVSFI